MPSVAGCTGVIRPVCTRSCSPLRSTSTSWLASWSRPRYSWTTPDTASSAPSLYQEATHGWLKNVRSRKPDPSPIVTVTMAWRRRVWRLATERTVAITVAYASIGSFAMGSTRDRSM